MKGFSTTAVHIGQKPDRETGAVIPPIYQTSTFAQEAPGVHKGFDYTRADNPNFRNLEAVLAALEEGNYATVYSSGLGAELAVLSLLSAGDHVVAGNDLYGGTYRLFTKWAKRYGISFDFVETTDPKAFAKACKTDTKLIWIESPTNPLLRLADIQAIAGHAKKKKVLTIVDNTFATPYFQKPLALGADMVLHSTTKYIGGHSDVIGGVVVTNSKELHSQLHFARMALGVNPSPFDCWLTQRGVKTLGLRMERHQANAKAVAGFLKKHPRTKKVYYPGFSGIVSAEFNMSVAETKKLAGRFKIFTLGESLGGVESLVCHPATMTHASVPGFPASLIRFSVGIEDEADLIADLKQGLGKSR